MSFREQFVNVIFLNVRRTAEKLIKETNCSQSIIIERGMFIFISVFFLIMILIDERHLLIKVSVHSTLGLLLFQLKVKYTRNVAINLLYV